MTFSFLPSRQEVQNALPEDQLENAVFFETVTKGGDHRLLVLTDRNLNPMHKVVREDVVIWYYVRTAESLSFVGQFFDFIKKGLDFAYVDDWNNIHVFVQEEFMSRAYGLKHNNIKALKTFLRSDVHIYPAKESYRDQIKKAITNRLLLRKAKVLDLDLELILKKQRGVFSSVDDLLKIDLEQAEQDFYTTYDFEQSAKSYRISLKSSLVAQLTASLEAEPTMKWTKIVEYAAEIMKLNLGVYHLSHQENNGESERVRLDLPDGITDLHFYEKPSISRWNKVVVEKSNSSLSQLAVPYFLESLHFTLTLRNESQQYRLRY